MSKLRIEVFPTGPFQANCILVGDDDAGEVVVIDPGDDAELIVERVRATGLRPTMLLHTHGHLDHAAATAGVLEALGGDLPVGLHRDELELYRNIPAQGAMFGVAATAPPEPTLWLADGDEVTVGGVKMQVRHTPGHSPGGVTFFLEDETGPVAIVGDALFAGSIGRTDLPGGSMDVLADSIRNRIYSLPDDTRCICGHGPDTTVAHERATNPFVRG